MLYNPKWEVQTKPDVFSLEGVAAWLEKMPANEPYEYMNCSGRCLLGQYMTSHGISWPEVVRHQGKRGDFRQKVYSDVAMPTPHTFGGALARARETLAA